MDFLVQKKKTKQHILPMYGLVKYHSSYENW